MNLWNASKQVTQVKKVMQFFQHGFIFVSCRKDNYARFIYILISRHWNCEKQRELKRDVRLCPSIICELMYFSKYTKIYSCWSAAPLNCCLIFTSEKRISEYKVDFYWVGTALSRELFKTFHFKNTIKENNTSSESTDWRYKTPKSKNHTTWRLPTDPTTKMGSICN